VQYNSKITISTSTTQLEEQTVEHLTDNITEATRLVQTPYQNIYIAIESYHTLYFHLFDVYTLLGVLGQSKVTLQIKKNTKFTHQKSQNCSSK